MDVAAILNDLNAAERAFLRVQPEMDALTEVDFTAMNVDVVSATSTVLGVADRIVAYRDPLATLPDFDIRNVDGLIDYATAAWFVFVSNLSTPNSQQFEALMQEGVALRAKLLMWAEPLATEGHFDEVSLAEIKKGSGNKDVPSDVVALVGLYRSVWDAIADNCAVTDADLDRGAQIGPYLFAMVSQRENRPARGSTEEAQRVRRAWTLVDRAYDQCRRGLTYLLWNDGELNRVAPSLRRNETSRQPSPRPTPTAAPNATFMPTAAPLGVPGDGASPSIGGGEDPFVTPSE